MLHAMPDTEAVYQGLIEEYRRLCERDGTDPDVVERKKEIAEAIKKMGLLRRACRELNYQS